MARELFGNNATSTLPVGIAAGTVVLSVAAGAGAKFPQPNVANGEYFMATLQDLTAGQLEIVKVTAVIGDSFTVVRAQEGTVAASFNANTTSVSHRLTATTLQSLSDGLSSASTYYLGVHATDPTVNNQGGALAIGMQYFNSSTFVLLVYNGTTWQSQIKSTPAGASLYIFHASSNQTLFSGNDINSNTLTIAWASDTVTVYKAGLILQPTTDYTTGVDNQITLASGAALNTVIIIEVVHPVTINLTAYVQKAGDTMTGALTLPGNPTTNLQAATKQYVDTATSTSTDSTARAAAAAAQSTANTALSTANAAVPATGGAMSGPLTLSGLPTSGSVAANKSYVDTAVLSATDPTARANAATALALANAALPESGGTMTGPLVLNGSPTTSLQAATKAYVDSASGTDTVARAAASAAQATANAALPLAGGTMTGAITLPGNPSSNLQAVTKQYVDNVVISSDVQIFTANGTWTKPAFATANSRVYIQLWGGGGGGGVYAYTGLGGGGGGAYFEAWVLAGSLAATQAVVVGAGGAGGTNIAPTSGGASTFFGFSAPGGSQGTGVGGVGGVPAGALALWEGGSGGGQNISVPGTNGFFGGGGGAGGGSAPTAGGTSLYAGAGGSSNNGVSNPGVAPGGGGSGFFNGFGPGGAGARGEVIITTFR